MFKNILFTFVFISLTRYVLCFNHEIDNKRSQELKEMYVEDFSVYYSLKTNQTLRQMMPRPWYFPGWPLRLPFVGEPCACSGYKCVCCAGLNISQFNFKRKVCTEMTYEPSEFMLTLDVKLNDRKLLTRVISAKNPPPFCIPVVIPYLPPGLVDFCIRLFDITVQDQMLHMCMDMETRIDRAPVVVLHFDCMNMGAGGVSLTKPGTAKPPSTDATSSKPVTEEAMQVDSDVFDNVNFDNKVE